MINRATSKHSLGILSYTAFSFLPLCSSESDLCARMFSSAEPSLYQQLEPTAKKLFVFIGVGAHTHNTDKLSRMRILPTNRPSMILQIGKTLIVSTIKNMFFCTYKWFYF